MSSFRDRTQAGEQLAVLVGARNFPHPVVLALPRGGVPVAQPIAQSLNCPLDVIVVRKLGVPGQEEVGFGAISEDNVRVLNDSIINSLSLDDSVINHIALQQQDVLNTRLSSIRKFLAQIDLHDKTAIIVDDGIATGIDAKAACIVARQRGAAKVVVAVPAAPTDWRETLGDVADEYIAVVESDAFAGVGAFYEDFSQVTDNEVLALLQK